jgi:hypothetical protein
MKKGGGLALLLLLAGGAPAQAGLTRFVVESRTPYPQNPAFETIAGHFEGTLDPNHAGNRIITDIALAPRNAEGQVEYSATFRMIKPVEVSRASGMLFYNVVNRGNGAPGYFPEGHIGLISGWQGDVVERPGIVTIKVPVARNPDGSPLMGPAYARLINMPAGASTVTIMGNIGAEGGRNFQPATAEGARLFRTSSNTGAPVEVPRADWALADCTARPFPGTPDFSKLCLRGGFDPKFSYQLSFRAKDPKVLGIGFAATRDLIAFLRYGGWSVTGDPNPLAQKLRWAVASGSSQSGNFLRSFVHLGFNAAEDGRIVFDGIRPLIAPRQVALNIRFANAGGAAGLYEPGSDGPVWWTEHADRGLPRSSLLARCRAGNTCPKIIEEYGAAEFWNLRASPDFVGAEAKADLPLPANVRRYYHAGTTHGGGNGSYDVASLRPPGACLLAANPNPTFSYGFSQKALLAWVMDGTEPPPSRYPTLARGELVAPNARALGFPNIPGQPQPDGKINPLLGYDFGPGFNRADLSGTLSVLPPRIIATYPSLVPRVDADGNELAGIRSPMLQVPLGSYLGWNVTANGFEKGEHCGNQGGFIPFAATRAERLDKGDPRLSLEERYGTKANYLARLKQAADRLVAEGYMLPQDAALTMQRAQEAKIALP